MPSWSDDISSGVFCNIDFEAQETDNACGLAAVLMLRRSLNHRFGNQKQADVCKELSSQHRLPHEDHAIYPNEISWLLRPDPADSQTGVDVISDSGCKWTYHQSGRFMSRDWTLAKLDCGRPLLLLYCNDRMSRSGEDASSQSTIQWHINIVLGYAHHQERAHYSFFVYDPAKGFGDYSREDEDHEPGRHVVSYEQLCGFRNATWIATGVVLDAVPMRRFKDT